MKTVVFALILALAVSAPLASRPDPSRISDIVRSARFTLADPTATPLPPTVAPTESPAQVEAFPTCAPPVKGSPQTGWCTMPPATRVYAP